MKSFYDLLSLMFLLTALSLLFLMCIGAVEKNLENVGFIIMHNLFSIRFKDNK